MKIIVSNNEVTYFIFNEIFNIMRNSNIKAT